MEPNEINYSEAEVAADAFINTGNKKDALNFLKANPDKTTDFCLQIHDRWGEKNTTSAVMDISRLIEALLKEKSEN